MGEDEIEDFEEGEEESYYEEESESDQDEAPELVPIHTKAKNEKKTVTFQSPEQSEKSESSQEEPSSESDSFDSQ